MEIELVPFDPAQHDARTVAALIYAADEELNALVYGEGERGVEVVERLLGVGAGYYDPACVRCAVHNGEVMGVLIGFPVCEREARDKAAGSAFAQALGFWQMLKRMPLFIRMGKITAGEMAEDGYYVHSIAVASEHRGRGVGRQIIERAAAEHGALYLHVNIHKADAQAFYQRVGFQPKSRATITVKNKEMGTYLMERA